MNKANKILSYALAASFLSAVADRFGIWGKAGVDGVVWGNFESFLAYTKYLNPWAPDFLISPMGIIATVLEVLIGALLITGYKRKQTALASCILLCTFALAMIISGGFKGPLDYSIFTAAAASYFLYSATFLKQT
jgi:uncharacterized membrane protein YphA (DoxX/SURF4 family)